MKLDVEGSELKIAEELMASDKISKVENLIIEYHPNEGLEDFRKRVCTFGFQSMVRKKSSATNEALLYFWK